MTNGNSDPRSRAAAECAAGHCESALTLLEAAFMHQPGDAELSHQIGTCYSGACRKHALVNLPIAIAYFDRAIRIIGSNGPGQLRAVLLDSLANAHLSDHRPDKALLPFEEAAQLFHHLGKPADWARTEFNLGNVCCELAESGSPALWETAIRHYLNALTVRREDIDPIRFAATAQNLGAAYRSVPGEDHIGNLKKAIGCYSAAFRTYSRAHMHGKCADLHNNLGNVFLELASPQDARCRNANRALSHFAHALQARTKHDRPCDYAITQFNRGQGYLRLAACGSAETTRAVACFREALDGFVIGGNAAGAEMAGRRLRDLTQDGTTPPLPR